MAVKRCPSCGDLYLLAIEHCASCDVELVMVVEAESEAAPGDRSELANEFEQRELQTWTMEGRRLLDGMLQRAGIPRSWQGATLLTPEIERDRVEEMVAVVGRGDAEVGQSDEEGDEDDGELAYDLSGWTDQARGSLIAALAEAEIEHGWDSEGDLVIDSADEDRVDIIFDGLTSDGSAEAGDGPGTKDDHDGYDDDGLLVQETMSDLFVGADRLVGNPLDGPALMMVMDARDQARSLRLPFGFERTQWAAILSAADALAAGAEPDHSGDSEIRENASRLRTLLRDLV